MKRILIWFGIVGLICACNQSADFSPREINFDRDVCYVCKMGLTDQRYNVQAINQYAEVHWYDDIGCLVEEMQGEEWELWKGDTIKVWIGDASKPNEKSNWIDAHAAYYDYGRHTPMGYGYSAFAVRPDTGAVYEFETVIQRINQGFTMREAYLEEKKMMMKDNPEMLKKIEEKLAGEKAKNQKEQ